MQPFPFLSDLTIKSFFSATLQQEKADEAVNHINRAKTLLPFLINYQNQKEKRCGRWQQKPRLYIGIRPLFNELYLHTLLD